MLKFVHSFEEANNYPVMFNSVELLMNDTKDVFYIKSVDSMGKPTICTYSFTQIENEKPLTVENFATREQFESLNRKLDILVAELGGSKDGQ